MDLQFLTLRMLLDSEWDRHCPPALQGQPCPGFVVVGEKSDSPGPHLTALLGSQGSAQLGNYPQITLCVALLVFVFRSDGAV